MKRSKKGKLILVVLVILSMAVNSYAAVVADNDGSAFITKAEFDAMKQSFDTQIENYNNSIDNKIDGAIAAYLAGIKTATKTTSKLWNTNDSDITFKDGNFVPTFALPYSKINTYFVQFYIGQPLSNMGTNRACHSIKMAIPSTYTTNNNMQRNLCELISGTWGSPTKIAWGGWTSYWREKFIITFSKFCSGILDYIDNSSASFRLYVQYMYKLNFSGYSDDWDNSTSYEPTLKYQYKHSDKGSEYQDVTAASNWKWSSQILTDGSIYDKTATGHVKYKNMVGYQSTTSWTLSNEEADGSLRVHSSQTLTDTDLYNAHTKDKNSDTIGYYSRYDGSNKIHQLLNSTMTTKYTNSTYKLSSIGMLQSDYANSSIYMFTNFDKSTNQKEMRSANKKFTITNPTLNAGWPAGCAEEDNEVECVLKFGNVDKGSSTESISKIDVYASYVPFTNKTTTTDPIKLNGDNLFVTTDNLTAKIKWTMKKDSVFYIKCVPHFNTSSNLTKGWRFDLLNDSSTVTVKTEH